MARSLGRGDASSTSVTSSTVNVPSHTALDEPSVAQPCPGQQVGVVLDHRRHDNVVGLQVEPVRKVVDRLGGVAAEDGHVPVVVASAGKGQG